MPKAGSRVMDPSCGDGRFLEAAADRGASTVIACDRNPVALAETRACLAGYGGRKVLLDSDFFEIDPSAFEPLDAIIGNPPFIRYQLFSGRTRSLALASALKVGVRLTRLTSSWAPFLLHAMQFLQRGGRLAMVVPAEIIQTQYGLPTLRAIARAFGSVTLLAFERNLFKEVHAETFLLLADNYGGSTAGTESVRLVPLHDLEELEIKAHTVLRPPGSVEVDVTAETGARLTTAFLSTRERHVWSKLRSHPSVVTLDQLGIVTNGYVSGDNKFFHVRRTDAKDRDFPREWLVPTARQSRSLRGVLYTRDDVRTLERDGIPHHLVVPSDDLFSDRAALGRFIAEGKARGVPQRYKCRVRQPWWKVPGLVRPDVLFCYMAGTQPRAAVNVANAVYANTLHGMRVSAGVDPRLVALSFHSSLALLSAEIEGRSYGGGILKLEPTELGQVRVPWPGMSNRTVEKLTGEADALLRNGDYAGAVERIDNALLKDALGISEREIRVIRSARERLVSRRINRARGK
jgi:adenine-specific DNA methylase